MGVDTPVVSLDTRGYAVKYCRTVLSFALAQSMVQSIGANNTLAITSLFCSEPSRHASSRDWSGRVPKKGMDASLPSFFAIYVEPHSSSNCYSSFLLCDSHHICLVNCFDCMTHAT